MRRDVSVKGWLSGEMASGERPAGPGSILMAPRHSLLPFFYSFVKGIARRKDVVAGEGRKR